MVSVHLPQSPPVGLSHVVAALLIDAFRQHRQQALDTGVLGI